MPGGAVIVIDPNKPREGGGGLYAPLTDKSTYDEARDVIDAAEAAGEEVKILGAG